MSGWGGRNSAGSTGLLRCAIVVLSVLTAIPAASAQAAAPARAGSAAPRSEFDSLFKQLLKTPGDRALNARFVEVALQRKDYEAAIGALDRLSFYNPNDAALQLQIGELYQTIGSYVVARSYYESAADLSTPGSPTAARAQTLLAGADRLTRPKPWSLFAQAGLRYQTNATAGPDDDSLGLPATAKEQDDWNAFGVALLSYDGQLGDTAATLEANLTTYYAEQFDVDRLDLGFAELNVGPRVPLGGAFPGVSVKPYAVVGGTIVADDKYLRTLGGGMTTRFHVTDTTTIEPYVELRDRLFYNSSDYPDAADQDGILATYAIYSAGTLGQRMSWVARVGYNRVNADDNDNSYDQPFAELAWRFRFDPFGTGEQQRDWSVTPYASINWKDYDGPDPKVDPVKAREEFEWRVGTRLEAPATEHVGLGVQLQYSRTNANLKVFDHDNLQVSVGPTVRF